MNLKLCKKIRQGMREMAQVHTGGSIRGSYPDDYEGQIPIKGAKHLSRIFHHDYIHSVPGELWAVQEKVEDGSTKLKALRILVRLKLMSARQIYKRAKDLVRYKSEPAKRMVA